MCNACGIRWSRDNKVPFKANRPTENDPMEYDSSSKSYSSKTASAVHDYSDIVAVFPSEFKSRVFGTTYSFVLTASEEETASVVEAKKTPRVKRTRKAPSRFEEDYLSDFDGNVTTRITYLLYRRR